jgi:hypothetical protein
MKHQNKKFKMKIRTNTAIQYKIIDIVNQRSWLFMALSTTMFALTILWSVGILAMEKLI